MAAKDASAGKKQNLIRQIIQIYRYTAPEDKPLPWLLIGAFLLPVAVFVVAGVLMHWSVFIWIFLMITAAMLGVLLFTIVLTRRADKVGYARIEGRPGAAVSVLGNINKAGFNFPEEPVWMDPKTKDAIWRGTGYNGVYLLGEGDYGRLTHAMDRQERNIKGVTAGSSIPVYRIVVGTGDKQVRLKNLRRTILKCKSYEPTEYKNGLMARIRPRRRFILTKEELAMLNDRLRTLQLKSGFGIPKGIDPTRPQRISRRAMRGR
ncbi:DUF4191 domain-containing protein [Bifidobacterium sp.]|jgi:hypothetical protein|uniref:DUF4191 domain-containing protein n=1 Tax=Bifidobacterium sp. TaxID=41200 RepID=UPI0025BCE9BD|nr:DUF4191 domain-containing protein [Bifidobacterium sp.]MCH4209197.1 DUF4191 domain-containing protein [Bifidobacterium sp.]MCI1224692.1 DUF4191 domain-containing protein [Bifidobacterium sp.]